MRPSHEIAIPVWHGLGRGTFAAFNLAHTTPFSLGYDGLVKTNEIEDGKDIGVDIVVANEWLPERARFYRASIPTAISRKIASLPRI